MKSLPDELQTPKQNSDKFADVTKRVLDYLPNIVSERVETRDYTILSSVVAGTAKFARLINNNLFIDKIEDFEKRYKLFLEALSKRQPMGIPFSTYDRYSFRAPPILLPNNPKTYSISCHCLFFFPIKALCPQ